MALNSFQTSGNSPGERDTRCRVGILGFGTVGSTVARRLTGPDSIPQLKLTHIADRRAPDKRGRPTEPLASVTRTERFDHHHASDVDECDRERRSDRRSIPRQVRLPTDGLHTLLPRL